MVGFGILDADTDAQAVMQRAVIAEDLGFDSIFVGHHRFTPGFGQTQHPIVLLAAIAARTERLRLGTSIHLLPLSRIRSTPPSSSHRSTRCPTGA